MWSLFHRKALPLMLVALSAVACCHAALGKGVIAVLSKRQKPVIDRNREIFKHIYSKDIDYYRKMVDVVIIHDGWPNSTMIEMQAATPEMPLIFMTSAFFGKLYGPNNLKLKKHSNEICPAQKSSHYFTTNYKMMCEFWYIVFQTYFSQYDWLVRIDDDIFIKESAVDRFPLLENIHIASPQWNRMNMWNPNITRFLLIEGLGEITEQFYDEEGMPKQDSLYYGKPGTETEKRDIWAPYTNMLYLNLVWLRENTVLQKYMKKIQDSNCIFQSRWGDLELWGANAMVSNETVHHVLPMHYLHASHKCSVNSMDQSKQTCKSLREHQHKDDIFEMVGEKKNA